jgi:hypothetical protein
LKACFAEATASSRSAPLQEGTVVKTLPVAGFTTSSVLPNWAGRSLPAMTTLSLAAQCMAVMWCVTLLMRCKKKDEVSYGSVQKD